MPACSRRRERAAVGGDEQARPAGCSPPASATSMRARLDRQSPSTPSASRSTPAARQASTRAPVRSPAVTMWAKGSPRSDRRRAKVRKVGRTGSCRRLSVMTMSRIGCACRRDLRPRRRAPPASAAPPPRWRRRACRPCGSRFRAGSHMTTSRPSPSACLSASARDRPARPPPAMTMRGCAEDRSLPLCCAPSLLSPR